MHRTPLLQWHFVSAQSRTRSHSNGYSTDRRPQTRAGTYRERGVLCWYNAVSACISEFFYPYADRVCSQILLRLLRSSAASGHQNRQARADNRGGQGVLHGAGVQDAHNVAGEGRRKRGEERPVQPVLAVQLDDLRKHPRKSRYASVTSGADGNKTESNQTHFLVAELHKRCSGDH